MFNRLRRRPEKNLAPSAQTCAIGEQPIFCKREVADEEEWTSSATSRVVGRFEREKGLACVFNQDNLYRFDTLPRVLTLEMLVESKRKANSVFA